MNTHRTTRIAVIAALGVLFGVLVLGVLNMPRAGSPDTPVHNEVAARYLTGVADDTNAPNVVNSIVTDYRAVDTLGEATVLFVAATAVATVLAGVTDRDNTGQ
ncbi:MAG: hydrogen gas-evolving membrane-bound hydrogenase subunit E [Spirochaetota bacterium]